MIEQRALYTYYLEPGEESSVYLERAGEHCYVTVRNNGTESAPIQNCFSTFVSDNIILPQRLKWGIGRNAMIKILNGLEYRVEDNWNYTVKGADQRYEILLYVDDYENRVSQIMICPSE